MCLTAMLPTRVHASPSPLGMPVVLNVDGLERKRRKWKHVARKLVRVSEWLATFLPDVIVSDAADIAEYYRTLLKTESTFIPYGAATGRRDRQPP